MMLIAQVIIVGRMLYMVVKRERGKRERFLRYLGSCFDKSDLYVGMKFKNRKQLRQAFDNYIILKGMI